MHTVTVNNGVKMPILGFTSSVGEREPRAGPGSDRVGRGRPGPGVSPEGCRPGRVRSGAQNDRGMCGV